MQYSDNGKIKALISWNLCPAAIGTYFASWLLPFLRPSRVAGVSARQVSVASLFLTIIILVVARKGRGGLSCQKQIAAGNLHSTLEVSAGISCLVGSKPRSPALTSECLYTVLTVQLHRQILVQTDPAPITNVTGSKARRPQQAACGCHSQAHHQPAVQMPSCSSLRDQLGQLLCILIKLFLTVPTPFTFFLWSERRYLITTIFVNMAFAEEIALYST